MDSASRANADSTTPSEIPQNSKLATYMNRSATTPTMNPVPIGQVPNCQAAQYQGSQCQAPHCRAPNRQAPYRQALIGQAYVGPANPRSHNQFQDSLAYHSQNQLGQAQLTQAMGNLSIDGPPQTLITQALHSHPPPTQALLSHPPPTQMLQQTAPPPMVLGGGREFIPMRGYYSPPARSSQSAESLPQTGLPPVVTQPQVHQENVGGTTYFYTNEGVAGGHNAAGGMGPEHCMGVASASGYVQPMYAQPYLAPNLPPVQLSLLAAPCPNSSRLVEDAVSNRNLDIYLSQAIPSQKTVMPDIVEDYGELSPLDGGYQPRTAFLATHLETGARFALRRIPCEVEPVLPERLAAWAEVRHPNIVRFHRAFVTTAFGDHSVMMVYDYHPACVTMLKKYMHRKKAPLSVEVIARYHDPFSADPHAPRPYTHQQNMQRAENNDIILPESDFWPMLIEITSALREIHSAGLACRHLNATKVVITGSRFRIAWGGMGELFNEAHIIQAQQDDFTALGQLALSLLCRSTDIENLDVCVDYMRRTYAKDICSLTLYLLSSTIRSITDLMPMIGGRFYNKVEALERRADALEEQLAREIDNGRHLRILIKLGSVNERPELNRDVAWSETGNRYMLKLFRDYLFHSVTADGRPWLDRAHIMYALNHLDAGTQTKVVLMARDEQSILVVSYAELKHCLEQTFDELMQAASTSLECHTG